MLTRKIWFATVLSAAFISLPAFAADEARPRTVSVSGTGEVAAEPDLAQVTLGVEARRPALAEARSEVSATVERVLALCKSLGIDPKRVNATRVQIQPEYSWNEKDRKRVLLGYLVSRQVQVELRDLELLGTLLERAVDAGVNQVNDPVLDSSRRKDLERDALVKAVEDARLNADTLARAAGASLGPGADVERRDLRADGADVSPAGCDGRCGDGARGQLPGGRNEVHRERQCRVRLAGKAVKR